MKRDNATNTVPVLKPDERVDALAYVLGALEVMKEYELPDDIEIVNVTLIGSRINGNFRKDSDLDVCIEYRNTGDTYWKECHVFNMFCDMGLEYNGIKLDFFPVLLN